MYRKGVNMGNNQINERVKKVIANVLDLGVDEIDDDDNFIFDLGADSAQSIELIAAFEEEFNIDMDEDKALEIQNVSNAADFISEHL